MVVESEDMGLKNPVVAGNCNSMVDAKCELENQMETYDGSLKVRKPYTITKQREKWTEEEHQKFLEALKMYGRGWRQIEEHVGTKTAVQIRSHAQKFFSKVVRGSNGSVDGSVKQIEIPPPRPKRKPVHPYPRKSAESLNAISALKQERSPPPNFPAAEKGTKSPTSVLSGHGSDGLGSAASDQFKRSPSTTSCTTDMQSISLSPSEKENEYVMLNSNAGEKKSSPEKLSSCSTAENFLSRESDMEESFVDHACVQRYESGDKDTAHTNNEAKKLSASGSFKLFGQTVMLSDNQEESPPGSEDDKTLKADQGLALKLTSDEIDMSLTLCGAVSNCSPSASGSPVNQMDQETESCNGVKADAPMLWWPMYQVPLHYVAPPYNPSSGQISTNFGAEVKAGDKERSCTDSNEGSTSCGMETPGDKHLDAVDSFSQQQRTNRVVQPCNSRKGFVPYKRCLAERDNASSVTIPNNRDRQKIRIC